MPIHREFRVFVRDGDVEHVQPYWPPDAVKQGDPDTEGWDITLAHASKFDRSEYTTLAMGAGKACEAVGGGFWSVDMIRDDLNQWWLTDMALGDQSFRWDPND
jgi:hypothetical protein